MIRKTPGVSCDYVASATAYCDMTTRLFVCTNIGYRSLDTTAYVQRGAPNCQHTHHSVTASNGVTTGGVVM